MNKLFILFIFLFNFVFANDIRNMNCMACHNLSNYTQKELKIKLKNILKSKETTMMKNILSNATEEDLDYLAKKYGKKEETNNTISKNEE